MNQTPVAMHAGRGADILRAIHEVAYFERATAHVLAGWIPKIPEIDVKLHLGRACFASIDRSRELERYLRGRTRASGGWDFAIPAGWRDLMSAIDGLGSPDEMLAALFMDVKARVRDLALQIRRQADSTLDASCFPLLDRVLDESRAERAWAREAIGSPAAVEKAGERARAKIGELRREGGKGALLSREEWLWRPLDRVPRVARPKGLRYATPGSLHRTGYDERNPVHIVKTFLGNMDEELTTMELFARCSYEHPDMPEDFHWAMGRQVSDESRHARACENIFSEYGGGYGDYPIETGVYDFHYQFGPCEAGGRRELLWRILLRSTVEEALSLDGFPVQIQKREHCAQDQIARMLRSILADEIFHVESGLRWTRALCGGAEDRVLEERELATRHYVAHANLVRSAFVEKHPRRAIQEMDYLDLQARKSTRYPFSTLIRLNRSARESAGMNERDIEQALGWNWVAPDLAANPSDGTRVSSFGHRPEARID